MLPRQVKPYCPWINLVHDTVEKRFYITSASRLIRLLSWSLVRLESVHTI
jgi:hypothetical protein